MALGVERDDLELELLSLMDDVGRMGDALMRQLADVDQALEPVADADEGAEVHELRDGAIDDVPDVEVGDRGVPRVRLQAADRQADATALVVDVDDLGLDLLTDLVAGFGVVDLVPRELALVHETVDATEVDEHAERRDRTDGALDGLAHLEAAEQLVALLAALLVEGHLLRKDQAVRLAIDLEDLEPELAADERLELLGDLLRGVARLVVLRSAREVDDLADRHEPADPAVDDQATLVVVDDRRFDDDARFELLLHGAPLALETGAAERQDDVAFRRLRLEYVDKHGVADVEGRLALAVASEELAVADDAFALGPDVDEDLVLVDAHDVAFDDVTVLEALDVGVLLREQLGHRRGLRSELADRGRFGLLVVARRGRIGRLVSTDGLGDRGLFDGGFCIGDNGFRISGRGRLFDDRRLGDGCGLFRGRLSLGRLERGLGRYRLGGGVGGVGRVGGRGGLRARGGLVVDGCRRDGGFGRRFVPRSTRFGLRRRPACLLVCQRLGLRSVVVSRESRTA
jgi:hypothetical protein